MRLGISYKLTRLDLKKNNKIISSQLLMTTDRLSLSRSGNTMAITITEDVSFDIIIGGIP